jgi:pyruvate-formate lyase-activating enzyme
MMKLMRLSGSKQETDIRSGKAPSDIFSDILRVKTYNKLEDISFGDAVHDMEFPQPFQAAAHQLGCSWAQTNPVAVIQLAGCNLDCHYCFIGDANSMEVVDKTIEEICEAYNDYCTVCHECGVPFSRVFRISGGEPLLQQREVAHLLTHRHNLFCDPYIWLDTNLTIAPEDILLSQLSQVGVCGCFKSHLGADVKKQMDIAYEYVDAGVDFYTYWASGVTKQEVRKLHASHRDDWQGLYDYLAIDWQYEAEEALDEISCVHENLPLRNTFIRIKYHYAAVAQDGLIDGMPVELWNKVSFAKCQVMREVQKEWCNEYTPELRWLPSHMVPLD